MVKKNSSKPTMEDMFYTYQEIGTPKRSGNKMSVAVDYSSQRAALTLIVKNFGGPLNIAQLAETYNVDKDCSVYGLLSDITPINIRNWSTAGAIPLKDCGKVAEFLKVKPEILNYEDVTGFKIFCEKWVDIVEGTYCLTSEDKKIILKMKPYPINKGA